MSIDDTQNSGSLTEKNVPASPKKRLLTAASYSRKSDANEAGVQDQHLTNSERARLDGYDIPIENRWGDDGVSGTTTNRCGLTALLTVIESGKAPFTRLYVRDRDRLARTADPRYTFYLEFLCKSHGVQVCYSTDKKHTEYGDGGDEKMVDFITSALKSMKAHQELADTRQRTTRGTRQSLKKGRFVAAVAPYGYDRWLVRNDTGAFVEMVPDGQQNRRADHHFRLGVNAAEQVALRYMFDGVRHRKAYAQIARELEERGTPRTGDKPWSAKRVRDIVKNPIHKGDYVFGRLRHAGVAIPAHELNTETAPNAAVVLEGYVQDAPLSAQEWERMQSIIDERLTLQRQRRRSGPRYLLTTLLRCSACNAPLHGHRQATRAGQRVRMYRHPAASRRGQPDGVRCPHANRYLHADRLEQAALEATRRMLASDEAQRVASEELARLRQNAGAEQHATALRAAETALHAATRAATEANVRAAHATSEMERQVHDATMLQLASDAQTLTQRVQSLRMDAERIADAAARLPAMEARLAELRTSFEDRSLEQRKVVVAAVVESMRVNFAANTVDIRVRAA